MKRNNIKSVKKLIHNHKLTSINKEKMHIIKGGRGGHNVGDLDTGG